MDNKPLISVIIPIFNNENYLAEAIESVLAQTYRNIEIIVVDDGSDDGSANVAKHYGPPVQYYFQTNSGVGAARNRGCGIAQGHYLAFLDADDFWEKNKIACQMTAFEKDFIIDMVFGHVRQFYSPELNEDIKKRMKIPDVIMPGIHVGTMLIKRDAFMHVDLFRTDCQVGEFIDWYDRAVQAGLKSRMLMEMVLNRRIHLNNLSRRKLERQTDFVRILKESLDRRRRNNPA